MKAPRKLGASKLKGHLMRFIRRPGFNPFVRAKPRARETARGASRRHLPRLCPCPPLPKDRLGSGMDGWTDRCSEHPRLCIRFLDRMRPLSTWTAKEVQREGGEGRTDGQPRTGAGTEPHVPAAPRNDPVLGTHVLLLFCLISLQQGFCAQCFAVDAGERGLSRCRKPGCRRCPLSALCGGTHFTKLRRGQQRWLPGTTGQGTGSGPEDNPRVPGMLRGTWEDPAGDRRCHPCPTGRLAPGVTFGADELWVLLPGAADVLQRGRFRLEALELLQPVLQAPGSLQHRSGVCGTRDAAVNGRDAHHRPSPTSPGTRCPPSLPPTPGQLPSAPRLKPEWVPSRAAGCHGATPRSHAFHPQP